MDKQRRKAEETVIKRKEAKSTMPVGAVRQEEIKTSARRVNKPLKKPMWALQRPIKEEDILLHDARSQFERQFIQECREDGMSDSEIQQWMQEI